MKIKATIAIDDDRWAKHPYGIKKLMKNHKKLSKV